MKSKRTLLSMAIFVVVFYLASIFDYQVSIKTAQTQNSTLTSSIDTEETTKEDDEMKNPTAISPYAVYDMDTERVYDLYDINEDYLLSSATNRLRSISDYGTELDAEDINEMISEHDSKSETESILLMAIEAEDSDQSETFDEKLPNQTLAEPEELEEPEQLYSDIGISIANSYVNIREKANADSPVLGKLHRNSAARIIETVDDWYYVESGSVKGYVSADYLKTGIPDDELVNKYGTQQISVAVDGLNVREQPDQESKKLTVIYSRETYPALEVMDEWIKIDTEEDNMIGYVARDYVDLSVKFDKAISREEELELERIKKEEELERQRKKEAERIKKETEIKYRKEVGYSEEELKLLACLVQAEAGNQSYEGKLAVANVVLNRIKSSKYPNSLQKVIYQKGQFSVAASGSLQKQLDRYHNYTSNSHKLTIKAAKDALSGANNIGNRLYFNAYKSAVKKGYDSKSNSVKLEDHLFW